VWPPSPADLAATGSAGHTLDVGAVHQQLDRAVRDHQAPASPISVLRCCASVPVGLVLSVIVASQR
jgi:hypothetical protein